MSADLQQIAAKLDRLAAEQRELRELLVGIVLRKDSRAAQAKAAGVHPTTLRRREKRALHAAMVRGLR